MSIADIQEHVKELAAILPETTIEKRMLYLMSEVGELAREVLKLRELQNQEGSDRALDSVGMEMYDVVWNICDLANKLGIDLQYSFDRKAQLNEQRDWH